MISYSVTITKQKVLQFLKNIVISFLKFQMIPAAFCGLLVTVFTLLTSFTDCQVGTELFHIL